MNERIRELWSQAGGHYNGGNQHTWPEYTITDPEKFAELIIRECCKVSDEIEPLELSWKTSRFVKLHFGIEE